MNIGTVAQRSGVPAKTIRYYESIGLIKPAGRKENGYRTYDERDVAVLKFISRARHLGFPIPEVLRLLALWSDRRRASADVKTLAIGHIAAVEQRIRELEAMRQTLLDLVHQCHGDKRPECPILEGLAGRNDAGH